VTAAMPPRMSMFILGCIAAVIDTVTVAGIFAAGFARGGYGYTDVAELLNLCAGASCNVGWPQIAMRRNFHLF